MTSLISISSLTSDAACFERGLAAGSYSDCAHAIRARFLWWSGSNPTNKSMAARAWREYGSSLARVCSGLARVWRELKR